jgi:hypothetical protein
MNAVEVAQNNFNSWNRHDANAIVAAYAKGEPTAPRAWAMNLRGKPSVTLLNRFGFGDRSGSSNDVLWYAEISNLSKQLYRFGFVDDPSQLLLCDRETRLEMAT